MMVTYTAVILLVIGLATARAASVIRSDSWVHDMHRMVAGPAAFLGANLLVVSALNGLI